MVSTIRLPKQSGVIIPIGKCRFRLRLPYAVINTVPVKVDGRDFHSRLNPINVRPYFIAIRRRRIFFQSIRIPLFCFGLFLNVLDHDCIKQSYTVVLWRRLPSSPYNTVYSIKKYFLCIQFNSSFVYIKSTPTILQAHLKKASNLI